ncbi:hypothetical protein AMJ80_10470 [bacterium SM23_31]|nr:MAG: hypothetical protein AMJ80_10470 [bacterium SM23_31]
MYKEDYDLEGRTKIAFTRNWEICVMNIDGSNLTKLTHDTITDELSPENYHPSWSPDGYKIVFNSGGYGPKSIYVINADGSNRTNLYCSGEDPSWSPNGSKIVFTSRRDGNYEIYIMNSDGSNQTNLTNNPAYDISPSWSPDGSKIAFTRDGIYVMNADGSNQTRLGYGMDPSWSPDGSKIAFYSNKDGNAEIYVMNADGTNQTRLTYDESPGSLYYSRDWHPSWSPDDYKIVFQRGRDILIMNADGSNLINLTKSIGTFDQYPDWSPFLK